MIIIFIHPAFPGHFQHLAAVLGQDKKNTVYFITQDVEAEYQIPGMEKLTYKPARPDKNEPLAAETNFKLFNTNGERVAKILIALKTKGITPDLIYGHSGSGAGLYIKEVFPQIPFLAYFEWYDNPAQIPINPDDKSHQDIKARMIFKNKNLSRISDLNGCQHGVSATQWQKAQFPVGFHKKISVVHGGINTGYFKPDADKKFQFETTDLSNAKQVVTFFANRLDPASGFPQLMHALPKILEENKAVHILIGGQDVMQNNKSLKDKMIKLAKLDTGLFQDRVHFIERMPYELYRDALQSSTVHLCLNMPYILSNILLEAMACECLVIAANTPQHKEIIKEGTNGVLVDIGKPEKLSEKILHCLDFPSFMPALKTKARMTVIESYSLETCLSKHLGIIQQLAKIKDNKNQEGRFG